jgi:hypothetical protein
MYEEMRTEFKTTLTSSRIKFPLVVSRWIARSSVGNVREGNSFVHSAKSMHCVMHKLFSHTLQQRLW